MANGTDYGWAYVAQNILTGSGGGPAALQFATSGADITGSTNLTYDYASTSLFLSGNLSVSGAINANSLNINVTNKTVTNITSTGSTKFGDSADDLHIFSGSAIISSSASPLKLYGLLAGDLASPGSYIGLDTNNNLILTSSLSVVHPVTALNNVVANRLVTVGSTTTELDGEANLTFSSDVLNLTGEMTASVGISSSLGHFAQLNGTVISNGTVSIQGGDITSVRSLSATNLTGTLATALLPNITSVGNLTNLTVDSTTLVVNSTTHRVGLGRTAPARILDISHSSDPQLRLTNNGSVYSELQTTAGGYLYITSSGGRTGIGTNLPTANLAVSGTSHFSDNVGIGTTSPAYKLDVSGDSRITGNLIISGTLSARVTDFQVSADTLTFGDSASDSIVFNAATASITNGLNFDSNTLVLDSSNNRVGIGVQFPETTLDIQSTTSQLKLAYNTTKYTTFSVGSTGNLDINPIGPNITSSANLFVSGNTTLGFDTTTYVHILGRLTASVSVSSSLGTITSITSSKLNMLGGDISSVGQVSAAGLTGTLATPAQTNITSVGALGSLVVDTNTLVVKSTTNRVGIGRTGPQRKLDVLHTVASPQARISYDSLNYGELQATSAGHLTLLSSGGNIGIGNTSPNHALTVTGDISASVNVSASYYYGDGSKLTGINAGISYSRRVINSNATASVNDVLLGVSGSTAIQIRLPSASGYTSGQYFTVKDESGNANVNNITILITGSDTIDGQPSIVLESPYAAVNIYTNGSNKFFVY